MEDAAEALKMSFAVFAFIIALSLAIINFNLSKRVTDIVMKHNDRTYIEEYNEIEDGELANASRGRIVGAETVIPTLYRYYKEKYLVDILDTGGTVKELFDIDTENRYYKGYISDIDSYRNTTYGNLYNHGYGVIWLSSSTNVTVKERVDAYVSNSKMSYNGTENRYYTDTFNFNNTYYQTFDETFQGKKLVLTDEMLAEIARTRNISSERDGTYFTEDAGTLKTQIHLRKR